MIRRSVHYSGRVQGVGFRYTACRISARFQITGYVRNLTDGRVEAVVEGETSEVDKFCGAMVDAMRSSIAEVTQDDALATGEFDRFDIRF